MLEWKNERRKVANLIPWKDNPRKITDEQLEHLKKSLEKFNYAAPIVIDADGRIVAGHMRTRALVALGRGDEELDVRVASRKLTDEEFQELALQDNIKRGDWDLDKMLGFDQDLVKSLGFDDKFLNDLLKSKPRDEEDDVPSPVAEGDPVAKTGQIFVLGEHRLMCGDAAIATNVEKLMAGEMADMVFTDPPYGVSYEKKSINLGREGNTKITGDGSIDEAAEIYGEVFKRINEVLKNEGGIYYVCAPQGGDQEMMMMMMMMRSTIPCRHQLIWKKNSPVFSMGRLDYDYQHEPILYGWKGSHKHIGGGQFKTSVWEIDRPRASKLHPTMKPVELVEEAILNSTKIGATVIDFFGGSGSTLIASERLGRRCFMMEIDPRYCDVIVKRWEAFTGKKAELVCGS